ncbi:MAG: rhomboid family intramembrane serine protease [Ignavibacteriaceae bacterium]|nr:rhomboid family intramembrane serine protease [Ignavibacteriaceae bacterium]
MSDNYRPSGFGGFSFLPPVIKNLLIINVVVFFIQLLGEKIAASSGLTLSDILTKYFSLIPVRGYIAGTMANEIVEWSFYPWQLITYQFMHGSFTHILFNMFALWMFGMEIENHWGSKKFLYFYLLCGVVAGLFHLVLSPILSGATGPTIGASGAIYGVLAAFAILFPNRLIFLYFFIPVKAKYFVTFMIVMEFMVVDSANSGIAHLAHLGGALAGLIFILADKNTHADIKNIFKSKYYRTDKPFNPFGGVAERFKRNKADVEEAKFYDINDRREEEVTQEVIDKILDKISQSGYQNLTEKEKKILFEASKKMN